VTATIDLAAFDGVELTPVSTLCGIDHPAFPGVVTAALPGVDYHRQPGENGHDELIFVDPATASALRVVYRWDRTQAHDVTEIAAIGPRELWQQITVALGEWEDNSRVIPTHWSRPHAAFPPAVREVA
jgi:hypothetical protein